MNHWIWNALGKILLFLAVGFAFGKLLQEHQQLSQQEEDEQ